jgi:MinD-like ATPase involved in chromosome partitioning or flagellar assembly
MRGDASVVADLTAPLWEQPGETQRLPARPLAAPAGPLVPARSLAPSPVLVPRRGRLMRPEDYLPQLPEPPELGWRRLAWRAGARWVQPGARELQLRQWASTIRRPVRSPRVIAVFSPKGGVGKSVTTALLGSVLALVRGNLVAALDANPDSGDLAARLQEPQSTLGAQELHRDARRITRYGDLVPYLTVSGSGLCAVRSSPDSDVRLGPAEYRTLLDLLCRFYSIVVVDLGTGMREPAFQAVVEAADAVVAVTAPGFDATEVLMEGLDWLSGRFPSIFRTAVAVINAVTPGRSTPGADLMADALGDWAAQVIRVPADPQLAGGVARWPSLGRGTQDAYLELAAAVIDALPGEDPPAPLRPAQLPARDERPGDAGAVRLGSTPGRAGTDHPAGGRLDRTRDGWRQLIAKPVTSPAVVSVFSPRGGVGKTTTAVHLGHALAMVRGDLVVALDANPDSGNLVNRVSEPHSAYDAADLHRAAGLATRGSDLLPYLTQADSGLWVARSGQHSGARLGAAEYRRILQVLDDYASVIVVDLGTGLREPAFLAIADAADVLVTVAEPSAEAADGAVDAVDWVSQRIAGKSRGCALVINAARPGFPALDTAEVAEVAAASDLYVDQVLQVPHDPHLAAGGVSRWALLSPRTQDAYLRLAAAVMTLVPGEPGQRSGR